MIEAIHKDIIAELYFKEQVDAGGEGKGIPHEEVEKRIVGRCIG